MLSRREFLTKGASVAACAATPSLLVAKETGSLFFTLDGIIGYSAGYEVIHLRAEDIVLVGEVTMSDICRTRGLMFGRGDCIQTGSIPSNNEA